MNWAVFMELLGIFALACLFASGCIAFINYAADRGWPDAVCIGAPVAVIALIAATLAGVLTA